MNNENDLTIINSNGESLRLHEVDPTCYQMKVQEFIEVIEDAKSHGIQVHYIEGKLYYSYNIWAEKLNKITDEIYKITY